MVVSMVVPVVMVVVVVVIVVVVVVVVVMAAVPSYECQGGEGEARGAHAAAPTRGQERVGECRSCAHGAAVRGLPPLFSVLHLLPARTHAHVSYIMEGTCRIQRRLAPSLL